MNNEKTTLVPRSDKKTAPYFTQADLVLIRAALIHSGRRCVEENGNVQAKRVYDGVAEKVREVLTADAHMLDVGTNWQHEKSLYVDLFVGFLYASKNAEGSAAIIPQLWRLSEKVLPPCFEFQAPRIMEHLDAWELAFKVSTRWPTETEKQQRSEDNASHQMPR